MTDRPNDAKDTQQQGSEALERRLKQARAVFKPPEQKG